MAVIVPYRVVPKKIIAKPLRWLKLDSHLFLRLDISRITTIL